MLSYLLFFMSVGFLIYGGLVASRRITPPSAGILIEEENIDPWCKMEGFTKILWGLDLSFLTVYLTKLFVPMFFFVLFLALTVFIIVITYKNNQKYMK